MPNAERFRGIRDRLPPFLTPETLVPYWTPMRDDGSPESKLEEHGLVLWQPHHILYGNSLEINTPLVNRFLTLLGFAKPMEIMAGQMTKKEPNAAVVTGVSAKGEAALGRVAVKKKKPKEGQVIFDNSLNHPAVVVNFSQIADYLEDTLPGGRNDPKFFEQYGEMVNKAFMRLLGKSIQANFKQIRKENPEIINSEIRSVKYTTIGVASSFLYYVIDMLTGSNNLDAGEISALVIETLISYSVIWAGTEMLVANPGAISLSVNPSSEKYQEYLKSLDFFERFYPRNLTRYLLVPYLHFSTWDKPLIRGKKAESK